MKLTNIALVLSGLLAITACGGSGGKSGVPAGTVPENVTSANPTAEASAIAYNDIAVHDPSVVKGDDGYYVFGSHLAAAKSTDLMSWSYVSVLSANDAVDESPLFNTYSSEIADGIAWTDGYKGSWAPDVIKAPNGKYWFYYDHCAQTEASGGCWNRSYLGLAESDSITGPFVNKGIFLRSGYRNAGEFAAYPLDNGQTTYNGSVDPNVIDPAAFYDKNGGLWMVYGSYSGGIYVLEMDSTTGMPKAGQGYGKHVAGGGGAAIEGSWITYSSETGYYYMFNSIAGFAAADGYNIRVSRSTSPDGPYLDAAGNDMLLARDNTSTLSKYGVKLMGGFNFVSETGDQGSSWGYLSPGHNSVYYDEAAKKYLLVTHARFPDRGEEHSVRVHELWLNHDGWFVASPQRYAPIAGSNVVDADDLVGDYRLINQDMDSNTTGHDSVYITLNSDRTITGEITGSYRLWDDDSGRITLTIGGKIYDGVMAWQWDESVSKLVPTFSALSAAGVSVLGSQLPARTEAEYVADIEAALDIPASYIEPELSVSLRGTRAASISWESSKPRVIKFLSDKRTGKLTGTAIVNRPSLTEGSQTLTLTATITTLDGSVYTEEYSITVPAIGAFSPAAQYDFEDNLDDSKGAFAAGTATGDRMTNTGSVAYDTGVNGQALNLTGASGVLLPSGLIHNYTYSISMWVKPNVLSVFSPMFFGAVSDSQWMSLQVQNWWTQEATLWSYNSPTDAWYACVTGANLNVGEWNRVAVSVDNGVGTIYLNNQKLCSVSGLTDFFTENVGTFALGVNYWDTPFNGEIDELKVYDQVVRPEDLLVFIPKDQTATEVLENAKNSLTLGDLTAVSEDLTLPIAGEGTVEIHWASSNAAAIDEVGTVTRPSAVQPDANLTLTATLSYAGQSVTKEFAVTVKSSAPPVPYARFSFDENLDESQNSLGTGTVVADRIQNSGGSITYADGVSGKAAVFDGASGVLLPDNLITTDSYSISLWLNNAAYTQYTTTFFGYIDGDNWISLTPYAWDKVNTMLWTGSSPYYDGSFNMLLPLNQWKHVVITVNSGVMKAYVDGQLVNTITGYPSVFKDAGDSHFSLGVNYWDTPFKGEIDELKIYDFALSADDIATIYMLDAAQ